MCSQTFFCSKHLSIVHTLSSGKPVSDAAPDLAEMALRRGGNHSDNNDGAGS